MERACLKNHYLSEAFIAVHNLKKYHFGLTLSPLLIKITEKTAHPWPHLITIVLYIW